MIPLPKAPSETPHRDPPTATPKLNTTDTRLPSSPAMRGRVVPDLQAEAAEWVGRPGLHQRWAEFVQPPYNATQNRANMRRQPALHFRLPSPRVAADHAHGLGQTPRLAAQQGRERARNPALPCLPAADFRA